MPVEKALQAIAEPRRREILRLVRDRELSVGEIAAQFDITQPAVSQHLRVLREARLVSERREGARRMYTANHESLVELRDYLGWMWDQGLRRLKQVVEKDQ